MPTLRRKLLPASLAIAFAALPVHAGELHDRCTGTEAPGKTTPTPADPYPLMAAGWGPELGGGIMASRWAEDWTGMARAGSDAGPKAVPLGGDATLTVSAEARLRYVSTRNNRLVPGDVVEQAQFRGIVGADLRLDPHLRFYGELGTGRVDRDRNATGANFRNTASVQQLFAEVRGDIGGLLAGAMLGRQEFADGPRQLLSLGDGANLHRSWNGVRLYAHAARYRIGAFELRGTRFGRGGFDDGIQPGTRLRGINGSVIVSRGDGPNTYLDPFWVRTEIPDFRLGDRARTDKRDTLGLRLWGRKGALRWDWTVARQGGASLDGQRIDAWGLFAVQSMALSDTGWKPKLTSHIDIASGGGLRANGRVRNFHPLYASSNYLGESQFLGLSNLRLAAAGIALAPSADTALAFEYARAQRFDAGDAVYAGGMRAYAGTAGVRGGHIGSLLRLSGNWSPSVRLSFNVNVEHLVAGRVLGHAGFGSGTYVQFGANYRY